ncbi:MAG: selenide, water dikinase SelD [Caulobacterales bacterium]|nr:selenide, water dikinase SelD [Caulobacterales bacterium]
MKTDSSGPRSSGEPRLTSLAHGGGCGCKIAPAVLSEMLAKTPPARPFVELLVGNESSDDAAVWRLNDDQALVATTDFFMPVVDDPFDFGRIAATNALSDIYAMGGRPILALALVGMPINVLSADTIGEVLAGGASICSIADIPIAGGHSIDSVEPIYGLAVMGLVDPKRVMTNRGAQPGDLLVLTKPLGVGVLSAAYKQGLLNDSGYQALIASTTRLNSLGPDIAARDGVHAMTDVTGFGLAGHALEMARGSGVRIELFDAPPILAGVRSLLDNGVKTGASGRNWASYGDQIEGLDDGPLRDLLTDPQTSGGLLVSVAEAALQNVMFLLRASGFDGAVVGRVAEGAPGVRVVAA